MLSSLLVSIGVLATFKYGVAQIGLTSTNLATFTSGPDGVRVIGSAYSYAGEHVAQVGDYNNDGINDFVVAGLGTVCNSLTNCGMAVLILGRVGNWTEIDFASVQSGNATRRILGDATEERAGSSVGGAGDINNDGFDDILIGASGMVSSTGGERAGAVFVIFGSSPPYTDLIVNAYFIPGSNGFAIYNSVATLQLGNVDNCGMGDLNGDGIDDFAIGFKYIGYASRSQAGSAYIIYGSTAIPVNLNIASLGSAGVVFGGAIANANVGSSIDNVGDVNGDGINDLLIGADFMDVVVGGTTRTRAGVAYLIYGSRTLVNTDLATFVTGAAGIRYLGATASGLFGSTVSGAGDINNDNLPDYLITVRFVAVGAGRVYVLFGSTTVRTSDVDMLTFTSGATGYSMLGNANNVNLGFSLSRAGDINRDGIDDFMLGALGANSVYIVYGSTTTPTAEVNIGTATNVYKFTLAASALGVAVSGGLDVTGDGYPDVVMGAHGLAAVPAGGGSARNQAGVAFMVEGPLPRTNTFEPSARPTAVPTVRPTSQPSAVPSSRPSTQPSVQPSCRPTAQPSVQPSSQPSAQPSSVPSAQPVGVPTARPSTQPSNIPSARPSSQPTSLPTTQPSSQPSGEPSAQPTALPSSEPSAQPTALPSSEPSAQPSSTPTVQPTTKPSAKPSATPAPSTAAPTAEAVTDSDGSSPPLNDGGIAGVVVGGVVFVIILIALIALCVVATRTTATAAPPATTQYEMTAVQEA